MKKAKKSKSKSSEAEYGQPIFLYPGLALRVSSTMQLYSRSVMRKKAVDKFVDNTPPSPSRARILSSIRNAQKTGT